LKQGRWVDAAEHASKVLVVDKDNAKALYRRGMACVQLDTESRLEQARADFSRVAQLETGNREVREQLQKAKERLKDLKADEKQRLSAAMQGGLYKEQHDKLGKQKQAYNEEAERRKEKEEIEHQREEARKQEELNQLAMDNAKRAADGLEELSLEDWRSMQREQAPKKEEVVKTDEVELDEEEKKLLQETSSKGYYHGRLGTVLSDAAPKPQQVEADTLSPPRAPGAEVGSEWNQAGTWEEKDTSSWVKETLTEYLRKSSVPMEEVTLPSGQTGTASAKVTKVKSLSGEAQIVMVRKQPRHGYNFEAELSFSITLDGTDHAGSFGGYLNLHELMDAIPIKDLKIDTKWKSSSNAPPAELRTVVEGLVDRLRESVRVQIAAFFEEYRQKK